MKWQIAIDSRLNPMSNKLFPSKEPVLSNMSRKICKRSSNTDRQKLGKIFYFPYLWPCMSLGPLDPFASPLASNINISSGELSVRSSATLAIWEIRRFERRQCLSCLLLSRTWVIHGLFTDRSFLQLESSSNECYNPLVLQDFLYRSPVPWTMHRNHHEHNSCNNWTPSFHCFNSGNLMPTSWTCTVQ